MVYSEATIAFPILASYAYHKGSWKKRKARNWGGFLNNAATPVPAARR